MTTSSTDVTTFMATQMLPVLEISVGVVFGVLAMALLLVILLIVAYLMCRRKKYEVAKKVN